MKILLIADMVSPVLYEHFNTELFSDVDLVLSAGDLNSKYLSFITTILKKPLLYVHGNHDYRYEENPPNGCICIEDMVYDFNGIRIAGFGGCMEYRGGLHQYTEKMMVKRIKKAKRKIKGGFDILLTHSPAFELGDGLDLAHIGFKVFHQLLDTYTPTYMIHGHQHLSYGNTKRILHKNDTTVINAYGYYILEYNKTV